MAETKEDAYLMSTPEVLTELMDLGSESICSWPYGMLARAQAET